MSKKTELPRRGPRNLSADEQAQLDRTLEDLRQKVPRRMRGGLSLREAIATRRRLIEELKKKRFSLTEIAEALTADGVDIAPGTLQQYMRESRARRTPKGKQVRVPSAKAVPANAWEPSMPFDDLDRRHREEVEELVKKLFAPRDDVFGPEAVAPTRWLETVTRDERSLSRAVLERICVRMGKEGFKFFCNMVGWELARMSRAVDDRGARVGSVIDWMIEILERKQE